MELIPIGKCIWLSLGLIKRLRLRLKLVVLLTVWT